MSIANAVRNRVARSTDRAWTAADFPDFSAPAVNVALQRMATHGQLLAVRHGLYWRGRRYSWGMSRPNPIQLAAAITHEKGVGWAGLSAANSLGLTTQVPAVERIAVPASKPRPVKGIEFVGRPSHRGRARANLAPLDVAVFEVLTDWLDVIDIDPDHAVTRIAKLVATGEVNADKLAKASDEETPAARERLRVVLQRAGRSDLVRHVAPAQVAATSRGALAGIAA